MKNKPKITKLTNEKFLNLYVFNFEKMKVKWTVASRRCEKSLEAVSKSKNADGVNILPYSYNENGEVIVYLTKEFRYPVNDFVYSTPAGLVENGRSEEETAKAEIFEEIGGEVLNLCCTDRNAYTSVGMTDEKLSFFEAEVRLSGKQHLEGTEKIQVVPVGLSKLEKMLNDEKYLFDLKGRFAIRMFLSKQKSEKKKR